ncbi:UvrD-helicase domain-containing protein [Massilia sp. SYSU DXS3249]
MTVPIITEQDLTALAELAPDLSFDDPERRAVLLESRSRDINAAPGSGKTTVLAAKLLLLGRKWNQTKQGVCVLSHTNVAREEIQRRLNGSVDGSALLAYPHFVGTIHAFVNQFLALPFLRSNGYAVDLIDDDVFSRRALAIANSNWSLRTYMEKNASVASVVAGLVYRGADLEVQSQGGTLPKAGSKTLPFILRIKQTLTEQGVYRYEDMFAFAEHLLTKSPHLKARLSRRFPVVYIDEMQDTSWEQERLLKLMFDDTVIMQRYGDINQRILISDVGAEDLTFPGADALPISTSKRFGPAIARSVASAQLAGTPVVGEAADYHPPLLLTYSTENVHKVIAAFGVEVLKRFSDPALRAGNVKALCARKQGDAQKALPGRTLLDYWPSFANPKMTSGPRMEQFWPLMEGRGVATQGTRILADRSGDIRRAILMSLRAAGAHVVESIKDSSQLLRQLSHAGFDGMPIRRFIRKIALAADTTATTAGRTQVLTMLFDSLREILPEGMTYADFAKLPVLAEASALAQPEAAQKVCSVKHGDRQLDVHVNSLASMKGETHLATLVLESYGWPGRRFDIEEALPIIAGLSVRDPKLKESHLAQYRNLYVGMSRPTSFLCLAVNAERVSDECKQALIGLGWLIAPVT